MKRWCHESGFELESFQYVGQYPAYFLFNGFLLVMATGYEKLISRFDWLRFLRGWIFVTSGSGIRSLRQAALTASSNIWR